MGAAAQSVVVTDATGATHKFAAERVKDITFIKASASDENVFSTVDARVYSSGAVEATFSDPNNPKSVTLWIVGPSMGKYLYDGVYTATSEYGAMTIDVDPSYSFVKDGSTSTALKSGTMNVAIAGKVYTITFDFTLADGSDFNGKYTGEMPGKAGRDITLPACEEPKVKTTEVNDYVSGEFYLNANDASWNYEMAVDFFAAAGSATLPVGTYTYSADNTPGTFGQRSYLDIYSPSCSYKFTTGSTVTVSYEGSNIVMAFNFVTDDGRHIDITYSGAITFPAAQSAAKTSNL